MSIVNSPQMEQVRRKLRAEMTEVEKKLWFHLRENKMGVIFRRQYSIGNYVVDFYCPKRKLAIELDGGQHNNYKNKIDDNYRTQTLGDHKIKIIRFWNFQITSDFKSVLEYIWNLVHA
jgi:very-short-patch-repair endonuclease